jgi:hypothetical protein
MRASRFPSPSVLAERYPAARVWLERGVPLVQALALVRGGILSSSDLAGMTREKLLSLPGIARTTLGHCERILGAPLPTRLENLDVHLERDAHTMLTARQWRTFGICTVAAKALAARRLTLAQLKRWRGSQLLGIRGVGSGTLERLRNLLGPESLPDD